jgi:ribosomal-protein-alanine N-acetyltransferase
MIRRDLPEVLEIERAGFPQPWTEENFAAALRVRNCIGLVAELGEKVIGFMVYELYKTSLHVLNFAVHPDYRLSGVGTAMVEKLKSKLSPHRRTRITLDIRETNLPGQLFFRGQGFRARGVDRHGYDDTDESAYRFIFRAPEDPEVLDEWEGVNRISHLLAEADGAEQ